MSFIGKVLVSLAGLAGVAGVSYYYYSQYKHSENNSDENSKIESVVNDDQSESVSIEKVEDDTNKKNTEETEPKIERDTEDLEGKNLPDSIDEDEEGWSDDKEKAKKRCGDPLSNWIDSTNLPTTGKNSFGRTYMGWASCLSRNKFKLGIFSSRSS